MASNNIVIHDIKYEFKDLHSKYESYLNATDLSDYISKIGNYLSLFKKIIDNFPKNVKLLFSEDNQQKQKIINFNEFKANKYVNYVIKLRNFEQHHQLEFNPSL